MRRFVPCCSSTPRAAALLTLFVSASALAQSSGRIDLSLQGYFLANTGQPGVDISGPGARFDLIVPKFGLLRGNFEGYRSQGRYRLGDNFLELPALGWQGFRWSLTGGDFRLQSSLTEFRFSNIIYPDLTLRGARVTATRGASRFTLFAGVQTLQSGPRIPFRLSTGQRVFGAEVRLHPTENLEFGVRLLDIHGDPNPRADSPWLGWSRQFRRVRTINAQISYSLAKYLRLFTEAGYGQATDLRSPEPPSLSTVAGASWQSERLTFRANYARQSALYLPVAGFFLGDRQGPFGEFRVRPLRRLELFGNINQSHNNLTRDNSLPSFRSRSRSGGASLQLPSRFVVTGQITRLAFDSTSADPETGPRRTDHQMWSAAIARPLGRHSLRIGLRDLRLTHPERFERQRSQEFEDTFHWKALVLGGAVRLDQSLTEQRRRTLYGRGNAQLRLSRFSTYAYFEAGRDLATQSLLTTSAISSSVFGASLRLGTSWDLQAEAFRYTLRSAPNPASYFVLQNQGVAVPAALAGLNQWSFYTRLTRQITFGPPMPSADLGDSAKPAVARAPGAVEGFVYEVNSRARVPASGVAVGLDGAESVVSDQNGRYRFHRVAEGPHKIALVLDQLPAEFDPDSPSPDMTVVQPGRTARVDFTLHRLLSFCGAVSAPPDTELEKLLIRLRPAAAYTTPQANGRFCFFNLRAGDYEVVFDRETIPANIRLVSPDRIAIRLDYAASTQSSSPRFLMDRVHVQVTTRRVLSNKTVNVTLPAPASSAAAAPPAEPLTTSICGKVRAPAGTPLDGLRIHLVDSSYLTSPDSTGRFCFYKIPLGAYVVHVLPETIPLGSRLQPVRLPSSAARLEFVLTKPAPLQRAVTKPAPQPKPGPAKLPPASHPQPASQVEVVIISPGDPNPTLWHR